MNCTQIKEALLKRSSELAEAALHLSYMERPATAAENFAKEMKGTAYRRAYLLASSKLARNTLQTGGKKVDN